MAAESTIVTARVPRTYTTVCFTSMRTLGDMPLSTLDYSQFVKEKPQKGESNAIRFIAYGVEVCPSTGKEHHQGVAVAWRQMSCHGANAMKNVAMMINPEVMGMHVEVMHAQSSLQQCIEYCFKDDGLHFEFGERPKQGQRSDIKAKVDDIMEGKVTCDELAVDEPAFMHLYGRTMDRVEDIRRRAIQRDFGEGMPKCFWVDGPSGCGKSHYCLYGRSPEDTYIVNMFDNGWMDDYQGQERVVFNDFRPCRCEARLFRSWW